MPKAAIDEFDGRILSELQREGRLSNVALAERIALSATPCLRRVRRLEREGVITGYCAEIDRAKAGFGLTVFLTISIGPDRGTQIEAFEDAVRDIPEVVSCHLLTGEADFLLEVVAPNFEHYSKLLLDKLVSLPGLQDVRSSFSVKAVKPRTRLPLHLALGIEEDGRD